MKKATYYARISSDLQKKEKTIESQVVELQKQVITDGNILVKKYIDDGYTGARLARLKRKIRKINYKIATLEARKQKLVEIYASGDLNREDYVKKNIDYDKKISSANLVITELSRQIPILHKTGLVETSIKQFCQTARILFDRCNDLITERELLLKYVHKIVYKNENVFIHGFIPIQSGEDGSENKIEFCIPGKIKSADRLSRYTKYGEAGEQISLRKFSDKIN